MDSWNDRQIQGTLFKKRQTLTSPMIYQEHSPTQRYKTNKKMFMEKVKECVVSSIDHLYDEPPTDDKHYICFSPYDPAIHDPVKASMLKPPSPTVPPPQGLSWVQPGSFQAFSKPDDDETT